MKKFFADFLFASLIILLQSCSESTSIEGAQDGPNGGFGNGTYTDSYEFTLNGCHTGKHTFSSASKAETQRKICEALHNDSLNKHCAYSLRMEMAKRKCSAADEGAGQPIPPPPVDSKPPQTGAPNLECAKYVAGNYPSSDERVRAAEACRGSHDLTAIQYVAGTYPSFAEREQAARICAGNINLGCTQYVAGTYPSFAERVEAARVCHEVSLECVKQVAGTYPSFKDRVNAARTCR